MNLEQQKKQARELLRALRAGDGAAMERLRSQQGRWKEREDAELRREVALMDAQFVVAREQGFSSWSKLKAYADPAMELEHSKLYVLDSKWMHERAIGLVRTRASAGPAALEQIRSWHPRFEGKSDEEILQASFGMEDALLVYAKEHGFADWSALQERIRVLGGVSDPGESEPFLAAFRAMERGELERFRELLRRHRTLGRQRGTNGNTLLNLAVSLAPKVGAEFALTSELQGAVNEANDRGWTPLHQAAYSNQVELLEALLGWGADAELEAHGSGGTPLVVALFWGHREAAKVLSRVSVAPGNLRVAAGLGRLDLVERCFDARGEFVAEASAARGFYRPHSGFPEWRASGRRQEVLDEALVWAAKTGSVAVFERLIAAGASLDADPYRGTPLIWAAVCNRVEAARRLVAMGARVNLQATFGGLTHGQGVTALHMAAQNGHLEMVKALVEMGADAAIREDLYGSDAIGAAKFFGQEAVWAYLNDLPR